MIKSGTGWIGAGLEREEKMEFGEDVGEEGEKREGMYRERERGGSQI